jgi:hypothetical protein
MIARFEKYIHLTGFACRRPRNSEPSLEKLFPISLEVFRFDNIYIEGLPDNYAIFGRRVASRK